MILLLWLISIVSFAVIQLPPGDFVTSYAHKLQQDGDDVSRGVLAALRERYGLDKPVYVQYLKWFGPVPARRPGLLLPAQQAGAGSDRRTPRAHRRDHPRHPAVDLPDRHPDRHLLGDPPVLARRLRADRGRLRRPRLPPTSCWR